MLMDLIPQLILLAVMIGLLLLILMASEQNNRTMLRVWGTALGMTMVIQMTL
jgi:hypothetical protein